MYQQDLADKLNKQQSDISRIEKQEVIEDDLLEQIALALEVPVEFLKNFDLSEHAQTYNNYSTNSYSDSAHDNDLYQAQEQKIINNFPIEDYENLSNKFFDMQKKLLAEKYKVEKENALLKQELAMLKGKK
jgi:transcriptional regulator with XRE-family HTH domain